MRKRNKLITLLLAAVLTMSLAGTAFAAEDTGFTDVPGWAEEYVERMLELKLIDPKTETTFGANDPMTRADLVTALYRLADAPAVDGLENPFQDVDEDAGFRDAVVWAFREKIINGRDAAATIFDPNGSAQRQEIAKIINEFAARQVGRDSALGTIGSDRDRLSAFPDAAAVADWAKNYMNWAVASGFILGGEGGKLVPKGTATRAQVAAILCRYMDDASTGDASKDDPRNGGNIGENELLVVSFGTSFNDSRVATIGAIEGALEEAFPDYAVRRGFTSNIIIEHIYRRDGEQIDDVADALNRAKYNGVKNLLVQPTHLMNGYEYGDLVKELEKFADDFDSIRIGDPLLTTDEDFAIVAQAMAEAAAELAQDGKTAVCWMGHGTEAASNGIYARMQEVLKAAGHDNHFVGTVEAAPTAEDLVELVKAGGYENVILRPMMIVAGDHANNDMADENDPESWYSVFTAAGLNVTCEIKGLGELEAIQQLLADHARNAKPLDETGIDVEPNPGNTKTLPDGTYTIEVSSSSSMFRVVNCELTVADGKMTAVLTLSGTGYTKMFVGTAAEADKAADGFIDFVENAEGKYTFTVPVEALDQELSYAALGTKWYDRTLVFQSATAAAK